MKTQKTAADRAIDVLDQKIALLRTQIDALELARRHLVTQQVKDAKAAVRNSADA